MNYAIMVFIMGLLLPLVLRAQGPYDFSAFDGYQIYHTDSNTSAKEITLNPGNFWDFPDYFDGLEVSFDFSLNLSETAHQKLFTFTNAAERKYLEIYYQNNTLMFRRFLEEDIFYDYVLLDPLFILNQSQSFNTWNIKLYFTSSFFWIETQAQSNIDLYYLSPVYFGVNILTDQNMQQLLAKNSSAKIILGDIKNDSKDFLIQGSVNVYAFNYSELREYIQTNFSSDSDGESK